MTLMEPFILSAIVAYFVTPLAAYALGIHPTFAVDYVALYGVAPLFVGFLMMLPGVLFGVSFADGVRKPAAIAVWSALAASSIVAVAVVWKFVHRPESWIDVVALVGASPFIAVTAGMAVAYVASVALLPVRGLIALRAMRRANPAP
ncbi:hypothetical protein [Rhizobium leguminosarum]|uniref:hypothetical protein n=1 Tax=Rhizobium leguminosarum TaxID=384 RepID=UPI002E128388|nr:hypothetical protein U8Q02_41855 [Rhizobium leguminosarum]